MTAVQITRMVSFWPFPPDWDKEQFYSAHGQGNGWLGRPNHCISSFCLVTLNNGLKAQL